VGGVSRRWRDGLHQYSITRIRCCGKFSRPMAQFGSAQPLPSGSSNQDRHIPFPGMGGGGGGAAYPQHPPAPMFGAAATTYARSPPTGTPSSYGRFIQKRGRVGSAVKSVSARPSCLPAFFCLRSQGVGVCRLPQNCSVVVLAPPGPGGKFLGVLVRFFL
jgi:hypothetical protein